MKLAIITGIWGRPEVFRLFARGIKKLIKESDLEITCIVAGSQGIISKQSVPKEFYYAEVPNQPLGHKMNVTSLIAQAFHPDYVLCVGSDDIITPECLKVYHQIMQRGVDYICMNDLYFYDIVSGKALYWAGYNQRTNRGHAVGTGRMLSKKLMDQLEWRPWCRTGFDHVLDTGMHTKLSRLKFCSEMFSCKEHGVMAVDVKSKVNMTPFMRWDNSEFIEPEIITSKIPYLV